MSKQKPTQLDKALTFILDNFTDEHGNFDCPYDVCICDGKFGIENDCDICPIQDDFNVIMGITKE